MRIFNKTSVEAYIEAQDNDHRSILATVTEFIVCSLITAPLLLIVTPILCINLVFSVINDFRNFLESIIEGCEIRAKANPLVSGQYFGDEEISVSYTHLTLPTKA